MTSDEVKDMGGKLIHLLNQQRLLYRQLQELAEKQSCLVNDNDPEMLLRVLAGRQRLIDRLSCIDRELEPIRSDWQQIVQSLPAGQQREAQELVANVREILGEILTRDEKDAENLCRQRQQIGAEIRSTSTGKRMNQAYVRSGTVPQSRFLDTKSE